MSATEPFSPADLVRIQSDSITAVYIERIRECQHEIDKIRLDLDLSDRISAVAELPLWKHLTDRFQTIATEEMSALRRRELSPHRQGFAQGRLDILDHVLNLRRMTPEEIHKAQERITQLQDQIAEYQEVLR